MAFPTSLLRLQKVAWNTFQLIIEKKKRKTSEIPKSLNANTKKDKLYALPFPLVLINHNLMFKIATQVKPFWRPGSSIKHQGQSSTDSITVHSAILATLFEHTSSTEQVFFQGGVSRLILRKQTMSFSSAPIPKASHPGQYGTQHRLYSLQEWGV